MSSNVIVLEFNELTPALMDRFINQGHLPNFKKLRDRSICYISDAQEEPPALEPWIQWVSIHTGMTYAEHGVYDLGDGETFKAPRLWDRVAEAGGRSLVFGSMNACFNEAYRDRINLVPDPWSIALKPSPAGLYDDFYHFIRTYVQEYTAERPPLTARDHSKFLAFMARSGLSMTTISDALRQLVTERAGAPKWKRAAILDRLFWDVFRSEWRRLRPNFATVFLNSTAHLQHYYWRDMEPEKFAVKPDASAKASDAIFFGYRRMDRIVGECLELVGQGTYVALVTALGQQPLTKYDESGGKLIFKLRDPKVLLKFAGYRGEFSYSPVMAEQFHLIFENESDATDAFDKLSQLSINGQNLMDVRRDGVEIFGGCGLIQKPSEDALVKTPNSNEPLQFSALFYPVEALKSGMHHPDGIFWLSGPGIHHQVMERKLPITEIGDILLEQISFGRKPAEKLSA